MTLSLSTIHNPNPGWYRGDFHCHTNHSDGLLPPPDLVATARNEALDFFVITDHNTTTAYPYFGGTPGILIIPGIEVTYKGGHFNIFGVHENADWLAQFRFGKFPDRPELSDRYATVNTLMEHTASLGLLNSINHPLLKPWAWEFLETDLRHVHALEIWNDPSWPDSRRDNPRAIKLWTAWLNAGWRITAVGGSDFHRPVSPPNPPKPPNQLGLPGTYVYAENLSGAAILEAVRHRRTYVSMGPRVTFNATVSGTSYDIGGEAGEQSGTIELAATVSNCTAPAHALIVKNGYALAEVAITDNSAQLTAAAALNPDESAWYRLDIYSNDGLMLAITNPIYTGPRSIPARHYFGDFLKAADL